MILATEEKGVETSFDRKICCELTTNYYSCWKPCSHSSQLNKDLWVKFSFKKQFKSGVIGSVTREMVYVGVTRIYLNKNFQTI